MTDRSQLAPTHIRITTREARDRRSFARLTGAGSTTAICGGPVTSHDVSFVDGQRMARQPAILANWVTCAECRALVGRKA